MQVADCSPAFAVITASPGATAVTLPVAASTFATSGAFVDHTTVSVESAGCNSCLPDSCHPVRWSETFPFLFQSKVLSPASALLLRLMVDNVYSSTAMLSSS